MTETGADPGASPLAPFLEAQGVVVLDGGLATALEARGHTLDTGLWSARLLVDAPQAIRDVHGAYLQAGADCITTASYQATFDGFAEIGLDEARAAHLLVRSVELALEARDAFWAVRSNRAGQLRPLVAASVGPYGAYLAEGAEYTGRYGLDEAELRDFHEARFRLLADSGADLLAMETIPSAPEARALAVLLAESPGTWAWLSFSCRDGRHLADGTSVAEVARACAGTRGLAAIGVNCVAPEHVAELVRTVRSGTDLPVVAYPNSGELYDAGRSAWTGPPAVLDWGEACASWRSAGASLVGGCCRVGPEEIRRVRARVAAA